MDEVSAITLLPQLSVDAEITDLYHFTPTTNDILPMSNAFLKVTVQLRLFVAWELDIEWYRIGVVVGYKDSKGVLILRSTAPYESNGIWYKTAQPILWAAEVADRAYKTAFTFHEQVQTVFLYATLYAKNPASPPLKMEYIISLDQSAPTHQLIILQP
ncbi:MAG: hypothetical protein RLZZ628_3247 [Bacteroidota bacterium]|jgi:hypothetical protein